MTKRWKLLLSTCITALLLIGSLQPVFAFTDVNSHTDSGQKIQQLEKAGVISGMPSGQYLPKAPLTYAQAVQMLVHAFHLNIDNIRFIKKPETTDYYTDVPNDQWYSKAFLIAELDGLNLPKSINPQAKITRESFAELLYEAIQHSADLSNAGSNLQAPVISDQKNTNKSALPHLERLVAWKVIQLDKDNTFRPLDPITRAEAAILLYNGRSFMQQHPLPNNNDSKPKLPPMYNHDVTMKATAISDQVKQLTLSWGSKPTTGYAVVIDRINFETKGKAVIEYHLEYPKPGLMQGQMVTYPKATTYIASNLTPVLKQESTDSSDHQSLNET